ncbi:hypothetical protein DBR40_17075 [Pedobacter sp. KBW01]|uniref:alpha-1,2-fucosyltransferase n=1 Tax=Pedobacter sp. KBW01 TaxID=2153364 RepID=UPI000F5AB9DA|nr:alpha-1,2-fucosyltransferase [Pedobacter sp. KBW01]RQO71511.1 hypothetical protein DBR40_17075 [Pedobacter sp. KBW01]
MIAVKLEGRLGNQLFQYAFIYAWAKKLGVSFYLDKSIEPILIDRYFEIKNDRFIWLDRNIFRIKGFKNFFSFYLRKIFYNNLSWFLNLKKISTTGRETEFNIDNKTLIRGFFQSESFFISASEEIKSLLAIKPSFRQSFTEIFKQLPPDSAIVTIHIRRTDYIELDMALPLDYYKEAISKVALTNAYFVFISDDPEFVQVNFADIEPKYISNHSEIIDFQFLIHANCCILSNSSFSWWGAYLNTNNPTVLAPKYWTGFREKKEEPVGITMSNWQLIEIK